MGKRKSVVPLNDPRDSFNLFNERLVPYVTDIRGEKVEIDLGDYLHGILDHPEMNTRVNWIIETLQNPEEIRRHWDRRFPHREIYVNTIYQDDEDPFGEMHLIIVERRAGYLRFWTTFVPREPEQYARKLEKGKLLWKSIN